MAAPGRTPPTLNLDLAGIADPFKAEVAEATEGFNDDREVGTGRVAAELAMPDVGTDMVLDRAVANTLEG